MKNILEKIADTFRKTVLGIAIGGAALSAELIPTIAQAQTTPAVGSFSVSTVTLPYTTLAAGAAGSGGTSTNLGLGWSVILTNTLTSTTWNSSSNAFVTVTNTSYVTNTTYADMPVPFQKDLTVFVSFNSSSLVTNRTLTFARILDSGTVDNVSTWTWTIPSNGATNQVASTNFPSTLIGGAGGVRIVNDLWTSTNALTMTNNYIKFGNKRFSF